MTTSGVIDLGEVRRYEPAAPAEPEFEPPRRRFTGVLVALAAVVATASAAVPQPAPLTEATIPAGLGDTTFAVGDQYYVVTSDRVTGAGQRTISAYGLPDARPLWQAPLPLSGALRGVGAIAGQMLISTQPELLRWVESVSIREDTGRVMWRRRALFEGITPVRGHVLLWTSLDGAPTADTGREVLEAVDPVTGAVQWSYRAPQGSWLSYRYVDGAPTRVVTQLASGRVEVRDVEDGRVLVGADLLPPRSPREGARYVAFAGDLMLVRDDGPRATAYGLERLDRRWTAPVDLSDEYVSPSCGDTVCLVAHSGGLRLLDVGTGRIQWSDPSRSYALRAGPYLLAAGRERDGPAPLAVLDLETGRPLADLGPWTVIGTPDPGGRVVAMRADLATARAWFARLDPGAAAGASGGFSLAGRDVTADLLGVAHGVTADCEARAGAVICRRLDARVGVWRLA